MLDISPRTPRNQFNDITASKEDSRQTRMTDRQTTEIGEKTVTAEAVPLTKPQLAALKKAFAPVSSEDHDHNCEELPHDSGRLSRSVINFWLDAWLLVNFVVLGIVAVIVQFIFPPGVAARGWLLWGMSYGQWCSIQFGLLALLGIGVLVHIMLHWTWVCSIISKRMLKLTEQPDDGIRTVYGVGFLIGILLMCGLCVAVAMFTIQEPPIQ